MTRFFATARFTILIAVIGSFLAAITLLIFGGLVTIKVIAETVSSPKIEFKAMKDLLLAFIQLVDLYLIATAIFVIALGLYELFVDERVTVPAWLEIHHLDDLKEKLIGVIVAVMAVYFLGLLVSWDGQSNLLIPGGALALVTVALTYFISNKPRHSPGGRDS